MTMKSYKGINSALCALLECETVAARPIIEWVVSHLNGRQSYGHRSVYQMIGQCGRLTLAFLPLRGSGERQKRAE